MSLTHLMSSRVSSSAAWLNTPALPALWPQCAKKTFHFVLPPCLFCSSKLHRSGHFCLSSWLSRQFVFLIWLLSLLEDWHVVSHLSGSSTSTKEVLVFQQLLHKDTAIIGAKRGCFLKAFSNKFCLLLFLPIHLLSCVTICSLCKAYSLFDICRALK